MPSKLTTIQEAIPSDAFQFGGEPLNQIILILTGTSKDADEDIRLDTIFKFYSGKLAIFEEDPSPTKVKVFFKVENISTTGDKTLTIRDPTIDNDFIGTEQQIQEFKNKALGTNTTFSANVDANSNSLTELKSLTLVNYATTDPTATATEVPFYRKDLDANNQAVYISKKENGVVIKVRVC